MIASILHIRNGKPEKINPKDLESVSSERGFLWIDIEGNDIKDYAQIKKIFHLHPLTLENLVSFNQRPKASEYPEYIFLIMHPVIYDSGKLKISEIDFVIGRNYLITSRLDPAESISEISEKISKDPPLFDKGPSFLLYSLIDAIVGSYFPPMDKMAEELDALESEIFSNPNKKTLNKLFRLKRNLIQLRKTVNAQRDILLFLGRQESEFILQEHRVYFRDVYEHLVRVSDSVDTYREIISDSMDAYLSVISNRLNEVMKVLTIIATIILPMSLVAAFYGMNVNFPEYVIFGKEGSYFFALAVMASIAALMLLWFRSKKWL